MYNVDCFFDIKHTFFKNQISQSCDKRKCRLYGCKRKRHRLAEDKVRRLTEAQSQNHLLCIFLIVLSRDQLEV